MNDLIFSFSESVAKEYGVPCAIMIHNFQFWIQKNKVNEKHFYEDHYWTYFSKKALTEIFPFWTERQIRKVLDDLVDKNVLIKGNFNKSGFDKTCWYAFADEPKWLGQNCKVCRTNMSVTTDKNVQPIPDNNTDIVDSNLLYQDKVNILSVRNPKIVELVECLRANVEDKLHRKINITGWYDTIRKMVECDHLEIEQIQEVMNWHFVNYDREYRHEIQSAMALRKKFTSVELAMKRQQENGHVRLNPGDYI